MRKSDIETLKTWINSRSGIKRELSEPTIIGPALNSKQRNALRWRSRNS